MHPFHPFLRPDVVNLTIYPKFMKLLLTALLLFTQFFVNAQPVKPYQAIVKSNAGLQKGILYKADSNTIVIEVNNELTSVKNSEVKWIKIKVVKSHYQVKTFVKYKDPFDESHYEKRVNDVPIRKQGDKEPTLTEQVTDRVGTSVFNMLANVIARPIHLINPSIDRFKRHKKKFTAEQLQELSYYSVKYQSTPHNLKSLHSVKTN